MTDIPSNRSPVVGFTGTRKGMTPEQLMRVTEILVRIHQLAGGIPPRPAFHHGGCVGADEEAAVIAQRIGYTTVAHPGDNPDYYHDFVSDVCLEPKENLERNKDIVFHSHAMIATPAQATEVHRGSGTWQTIRYCRIVAEPLYIIEPSGELHRENFHNEES